MNKIELLKALGCVDLEDGFAYRNAFFVQRYDAGGDIRRDSGRWRSPGIQYP
jgi:hypothetical protein